MTGNYDKNLLAIYNFLRLNTVLKRNGYLNHMNHKGIKEPTFVSASEDVKEKQKQAKRHPESINTLAFADQEFLLREECRPVRLQLELLRPELILLEHNIDETVVIFGSARIPSPKVAKERLKDAASEFEKDPQNREKIKRLRRAERVVENSAYLDEATKFAKRVSECTERDFTVLTGGGPSFMEAANKGAHLAKKHSVALNMLLPNEQLPNPYVTPELTFTFHYFAIRKMHFLMRAKAVAAFPGGFGTMDELFELLTLIQTKKMKPIPVILFGRSFWKTIFNFEGLLNEGTINEEDLSLFHIVDTAEEGWQIIRQAYGLKKP